RRRRRGAAPRRPARPGTADRPGIEDRPGPEELTWSTDDPATGRPAGPSPASLRSSAPASGTASGPPGGTPNGPATGPGPPRPRAPAGRATPASPVPRP